MTRLKVLSRSSVFAWSPKSVGNLYLAAGTTAQQFDATFSTAASLDLCSLNDLSDPTLDLKPTKSIEVEHRFHRLIWSNFSSDVRSDGLLIGGCDNGILSLYDVNRALSDDSSNCKIHQSQSHTGYVMALDTNPFQTKLLASGASSSEIFVWDLNQPETPMAPGPKQQPFDQVVCVQWNKKVEHILGSLTSGRALLWDLRKTDGPILTLGDLGTRVQWKQLCWHPEQPTSVCLASEDDNYPIAQVWDVRFANSPVLQMEGHQKGILSMDWCAEDPDLLVTCAKDMKMYLWNPNTGQYLAEIPYAARNWPFQVSWSYGNPNLIGCSSLDGRVTIYSLIGGAETADSGVGPLASPKLADSFPGADFTQTILSKQQASHQPSLPATQPVNLPQVPRWLRPGACCARFGFGGRLINFTKPTCDLQEQTTESVQRVVDITQIITNEELCKRNFDLQSAVDSNQMFDYCDKRASMTQTEPERMLWSFLSAHCNGSSRADYGKVLDIGHTEADNIRDLLGPETNWKIGAAAAFDRDHDSDGTEDDSAASELNESSASKATSDFASMSIPLRLETDPNSPDVLITQTILCGNIAAAVELCIRDGQWADAFQLALSGSDRLFRKVQQLYVNDMAQKGRATSRLIGMITASHWAQLVDTIDLRHWKEVLSMMLSYAGPEKFGTLAVRMAERMQTEESTNFKPFAPLAAIMASSVEKFVQCLEPKLDHPSSVQDIIEKVTVLRWSIGSGSQRIVSIGQHMSSVLAQYATLLTAQGCLHNAYNLLVNLPDETKLTKELLILRDRLAGACGVDSSNKRRTKPFAINSVLSVNEAARKQSIGRQPAGQGYPVRSSVSSQYNSMSAQQYANYNYTMAAAQQQLMSSQQQYQQPIPSPSLYQQPIAPPPSIPGYGSTQPLPPPPTAPTSTVHTNIGAVKTSRSRYPSYASEGLSYPGSGQHSPIQQTAPIPNPFGQPAASAYSQYEQTQFGVPSTRNPPIAAVPPQQQRDPWNDPPPVEFNKTESKPVEIPAPLTQPVLGGMPPDQHVPPPMGSPFGQTIQRQGMQPFNPTPQQQQIQEEQVKPIPAEHLPIQQVLDIMIQLCLGQHGTPIMKRRLEDARNKIQSQLYSRLRGGRLNSTTLMNLHYFIQYIQARDHNSALAIHAQMAQGNDFSEISHFMSPLKIVVQTATQLGVYYG